MKLDQIIDIGNGNFADLRESFEITRSAMICYDIYCDYYNDNIKVYPAYLIDVPFEEMKSAIKRTHLVIGEIRL